MDQQEGKIVVIGDDVTITGFKLAGVKYFYKVSDINQAKEALEKCLADDSIAILVILDKYLEKMDWRIKRKIELVAKPIVVSIPSKDGPIEEEVSLAKLIKRALGFDIINSKNNSKK
jgi:vacuolar-type H+-ATPase subunit F/Vma7